MRINADFDQRVAVSPMDHHWVDSPTPGVSRMMLDRVGGEVARATSLVRYAPNSDFPAHEHGGGEEILVLEGTFADEHGTYPAGSYLRNPIGTRHAPRVGADGALLFVKLHQFSSKDQRSVKIHTGKPAWLPGRVAGLKVMPLHEYGGERVELLRWPPKTSLTPKAFPAGAEILVLEGGFTDREGNFDIGSWVRLPPGAIFAARSGSEGALIYLKSGHLPTRPGLAAG